MAGQIIATSSRRLVTSNGGNPSPKCPKHSELGISEEFAQIDVKLFVIYLSLMSFYQERLGPPHLLQVFRVV